jgi:UDP-3-O-[3-hydroxymyristoyl] N-acetylglucosamine deacetylase
MSLHPAPPDSGIVFEPSESHRAVIAAVPENIADSRFATTLGVNGSRVHTVEHLMAAAGALGISNLLVKVEGEEIPALDGSAKPFVELLQAAGRVTQPRLQRPLVIHAPIRVGDGARWLEILPSKEFRISYTLDLDHPAVGFQTASFACTEKVFVEELAAARTYGFLKDVGSMRKNGLAKGGSLENAVVVGRRVIINGDLRFQDEFVRHKILDLIGDLTLLGRPVLGHVVARNAGHALNHRLVWAIHQTARLDAGRVCGEEHTPHGSRVEPVSGIGR